MMATRRQLPLPDNVAPSRRPPPPVPSEDEGPPPPVPSRPTPARPSPAAPVSSRPPPKPPVQEPPQQDSVYDDGDVGDEAGQIYDEAELGAPEDEEFEQQTYDDMDVGDVQEEYADCDAQEEEFTQESYDEFGGVAQDTYEVGEPQEEYQECDIGAPIQEDVYQVADDDDDSPRSVPQAPAVPAPSLPPPRPKKDTPDPPPPSKKQPPKSSLGVGMPAIGTGDILNVKDRLKRVNIASNEKIEKKEVKTYADSNEIKQKMNFFKQKEKEALAGGMKPDLKPKPAGLIIKKSTSVDSPLPLPKRNASDSLPHVPKHESPASPSDDNLPPPPPPVSVIPPHHHRDLPLPPGTPPQRGKDGYTKVTVDHDEENNNDDDLDQEIYDDALSFEDPLLKEKWYFEIDRLVGNDKLKKLGVNGGYLLRKSMKGGDKQPYTLMVYFKNHVYNLKIRERNDGRVALGEEKPDEMSFKSVIELITHHQKNDVILVHRDGMQEATMLEKCPPK